MTRTFGLASLTFAVAVGCFLAQTASAAGRIYKCRNAQGEIYYSQSIDRKRCAGGGAQLNADGVAIKQIERQKSAEERAADKAAAEVAAAQAAEREADELADRALSATFANDRELYNFYAEQLSMVDGEIAGGNASLKNQQRSLGTLLSAAADAERAGKPVPERVAENIVLVRSQIEKQRAHIEARRTRKSELANERDYKIQRFKELAEARERRSAAQ